MNRLRARLDGLDPFRALGAQAAARPLLSKVQDVVNLRDYQAALNSIDDDAPAWANLFAARPAGEVRVVVDGYCRINSTITPPAGMSNVVIDFRGGGYLYNPNHGFDMLHLPTTVAGWELLRPRFFTDAGASGATERFFLRNDSNDLIIENFWARNCWSGIFNSGAKVSLFGRTYLSAIKPLLGSAVLLDMVGNEVFLLVDLFAENAPGQDCLAGVQVVSGGSIILGGTGVKCGEPLLVAPTIGKIVATLGLWPYFNGDTSSGSAAHFTGAGTIQRVEGVLRASSCAGPGLLVDLSPRSADLLVRAVDNVGHGVDLASGGSQFNSRYRIMGFGNDMSAFNARPGCTDFSVDVIGGSGDDFGGNARYTAEIGAGCDHFDVNVRGAGDTLGLFLNGAGTSATKVLTARN